MGLNCNLELRRERGGLDCPMRTPEDLPVAADRLVRLHALRHIFVIAERHLIRQLHDAIGDACSRSASGRRLEGGAGLDRDALPEKRKLFGRPNDIAE